MSGNPTKRTGLDFARAVAEHFALPTAQVRADNLRLHHGIGDDLAVTLTINLLPTDLAAIGGRVAVIDVVADSGGIVTPARQQ